MLIRGARALAYQAKQSLTIVLGQLATEEQRDVTLLLGTQSRTAAATRVEREAILVKELDLSPLAHVGLLRRLEVETKIHHRTAALRTADHDRLADRIESHRAISRGGLLERLAAAETSEVIFVRSGVGMSTHGSTYWLRVGGREAPDSQANEERADDESEVDHEGDEQKRRSLHTQSGDGRCSTEETVARRKAESHQESKRLARRMSATEQYATEQRQQKETLDREKRCTPSARQEHPSFGSLDGCGNHTPCSSVPRTLCSGIPVV